MDTKICSRCKVEKSKDEFYKHYRYKDEHVSHCKTCQHIYQTKPEIKSRIKIYNAVNKLKWKYGITKEQYDILLKSQDGKCAICKRVETKIHHQSKATVKLAVDHDHKTGKVRGLLCSRCNLGIGYFQNDPDSMLNAVEYVNKSKEDEQT